jgi:GH24 family phage-related lysozyme (muramidase)
MSGPIPAGDYVAHFDPDLPHHRVWLRAVLEQLVAHEPQALEEGGTLRRLWTARQAAAGSGQAPVADTPAAVAVALPLVREFEGCRRTAYPDPETGGAPWTIGWGSTRDSQGRPFKEGDRISQEEAVGAAFSEGVALLRSRLEADWRRLRDCIPIYKALSVNRQAALLSFTTNCGPRWFGAQGFDTLSKALKAGQLEAVPAALMLYVNPGGPSEAGLRRRRKAEGALWSASPSSTDQGSKPSPERVSPSQVSSHPNPLVDVPRFHQRDSAQLAQPDRTCFSSSCAMLLEAIKPGTLQGTNGDDQVLAVVQHLVVGDDKQLTSGDTTDANAQLQALAHYGVSARLVQNADFQLIEQQIARGIPIPCGYIHRGPVDRPTGSGHWLIVIGHTPTQVVVNDPWGEPDLIHGTTLNANGMGLRFSRQNYRYAGLRLRQTLDGGADRRRGLPLCPDRCLQHQPAHLPLELPPGRRSGLLRRGCLPYPAALGSAQPRRERPASGGLHQAGAGPAGRDPVPPLRGRRSMARAGQSAAHRSGPVAPAGPGHSPSAGGLVIPPLPDGP